jgi:hypothetical protein
MKGIKYTIFYTVSVTTFVIPFHYGSGSGSGTVIDTVPVPVPTF